MATQSTEDLIWMSTQALAVVRAELEDLSGPKRADIVARISDARDEGDLKENGGYHAAKEEQGKLEARVRQLDEYIRVADTTPPADDGIVGPGKLVKTKPRYSDDDKQEAFLLAHRIVDDAYPDDLDIFSPDSPFGGALCGAKTGDVVDFEAPNGKTVKITILDVTPYA